MLNGGCKVASVSADIAHGKCNSGCLFGLTMAAICVTLLQVTTRLPAQTLQTRTEILAAVVIDRQGVSEKPYQLFLCHGPIHQPLTM